MTLVIPKNMLLSSIKRTKDGKHTGCDPLS